MNMLSKTELPVPTTEVPATRVQRVAGAAGEVLRDGAARILPLLITLGVILGLWQLLCSQPGATLPPPSKVVSDTWELIADPFYDRGALDKGLFWQLLASLKRVAFGFSLAAAAGIALGVLIGQSTIAMRGLGLPRG